MDHVETIDYAMYAWSCTLCGAWGECESDVEAVAEIVQHQREKHEPDFVITEGELDVLTAEGKGAKSFIARRGR